MPPGVCGRPAQRRTGRQLGWYHGQQLACSGQSGGRLFGQGGGPPHIVQERAEEARADPALEATRARLREAPRYARHVHTLHNTGAGRLLHLSRVSMLATARQLLNSSKPPSSGLKGRRTAASSTGASSVRHSHMSMRLRAHILPRLSRTATALISSNMPGTLSGQQGRMSPCCTGSPECSGESFHGCLGPCLPVRRPSRVESCRGAQQEEAVASEPQHRPRHVCKRWPEPSAPVSLSRPTMIIIPKSKPAAQSKSAGCSAACRQSLAAWCCDSDSQAQGRPTLQ